MAGIDILKSLQGKAHFTSAERICIGKWLKQIPGGCMPEIREILENSALNSKQKGEKIFQLLRRKRYPLLTKWETLFKRKADRLFGKTKIRFSSQPYFEGNEITARLTFKNREEFACLLEKLAEHEKDIIDLIPPYNK